MKKSDKIKARKRIENGCNFPHAMTSSKYPSLTSNSCYNAYYL